MRTEKRSQPQIKNSESSLRNRLGGIGTYCNYEPSPLGNGCVPVDIDVSPFDNSGIHKAGVSRTCKNFDGYAPIFAYIGTEGYLCNAELAHGHCNGRICTFPRVTEAF